MFEPASPDTFGYLVLGLLVVSAIVLLFIGSMVVRYRNLQKDLQLIEQLETDQGGSAVADSASRQ